jgi:hypothetical protein
MPRPDPIWTYFIQLGYVSGFRQKRSECKECKHQINDSLRSARTHFKSCTKITPTQKRIYFGDSYKGSDNDESISTRTSTLTSASREADYISDEEQKSLELTFARSIFRCGLFLSLPELEPIKELATSTTCIALMK